MAGRPAATKILLMTSRPGDVASSTRRLALGTTNFVLTTRATLGQAMKMAGGSSWKICCRSLTAVRTVRIGRSSPQAIEDVVSRCCMPAEFCRVKEAVGPDERSTAGALQQHRIEVAGPRCATSSCTGHRSRCPCRRRFRRAASEAASAIFSKRRVLGDRQALETETAWHVASVAPSRMPQSRGIEPQRRRFDVVRVGLRAVL